MRLDEHLHRASHHQRAAVHQGSIKGKKSDDASVQSSDDDERSLFSIGSLRSKKKKKQSKKKKRKKSKKKDHNKGHGSTIIEKKGGITSSNKGCEKTQSSTSSRSQGASTHHPPSATSKLKILRDMLFREKDRKNAKRDMILKTSSDRDMVVVSPVPSDLDRRPSSSSMTSDSDESPVVEATTVATTPEKPKTMVMDGEQQTTTEYQQHLVDWREEHSRKRECTVKRIEKIDQALRDHEEKIRSSMRTLQVVDENEALNASLDELSVSTTTTEHDQVLETFRFVSKLSWTVSSSSFTRTGLYTGSSLRGELPHGHGILHFNDGAVYSGPFSNGHMDGAEGTLKSRCGDHYVGDFCRSQKHGHGEEIYQSGCRYIGNYENGLRNGFGVLYRQDKSVFHLGKWQHGKPLIRKNRQTSLGSIISEASTKASDSSVSTEESNGGTSIYEDSSNDRSLSTRVSSSRSLGLTLDAHIAANLPRPLDADELSMSTSSSSNSGHISIYDSRYDTTMSPNAQQRTC